MTDKTTPLTGEEKKTTLTYKMKVIAWTKEGTIAAFQMIPTKQK